MYFQVLLHLFYKLSARYSAPPADETPPSRARSLGGGTEREKGTAAMSESRRLAASGTARQTGAILDRRVCRERITRRNGSRKGRV